MSHLVEIYIGRQPIFTKDMRVYAYELLFRSNSENNRAVILEGDEETAQVIINLFTSMGISNVVGTKKAFINFTEGLLVKENQPFFPPHKVVIEVLEKITPKEDVLAALSKLKSKGFVIALDDYVFDPDMETFEPYADIIKIDVLATGPKKLIEKVPLLKSKGVKLLAEKVENRDQFDFCKKLGFDFFQGYFFAKPQILKGKNLPANKLALLKLLASVYEPNVDMKKLSDIISHDVSISQKILRLASLYTDGRKVTSVHDAVIQFGLNRLQSWASLMILSNVDDKPSELLTTSLIRAKFCELVGEKLKGFPKESYFTVGLLSTLDAVMEAPLEVLLTELNLDAPIKEAMINFTGSLGMALQIVKALEVGATKFAIPDGLTAIELSQFYLEAMAFAQNVKLL